MQVNSSPTCADMMGRSAAGGGGPLNHFGNGGLHQRSLPPLERGGSNGRPPLVQTNSLGRSLPQPPPPPPPPAPSGGGHHQLNLKLGGALGGLTGLFSRKRRGRQIYSTIPYSHFLPLKLYGFTKMEIPVAGRSLGPQLAFGWVTIQVLKWMV